MDRGFAVDHYGFPALPRRGERHTAPDGSVWEFDLTGTDWWELAEYAPAGGVERHPLHDRHRLARTLHTAARDHGCHNVHTGVAGHLADAVIAAGWRPPAQVIETPEELEALHGGTVIRSRHGGIGSIDHGGADEWLGPATVVHFLDFAAASRMTVADIAVELPESFPWTVLYSITERPTNE
jgi:hypothetical protein